MFLLDTNVVSELRQPRKAHVSVLAWAQATSSADLKLSVVTAMELEIGRLRLSRRDPEQAGRLGRWIERTMSEFPLLPVDVAVAMQAASFHVPDPRQERDALIGATALVHGLTVVTRNVKDFAPLGVPLLNPWEWVA